jgi:hypothetical protein
MLADCNGLGSSVCSSLSKGDNSSTDEITGCGNDERTYSNTDGGVRDRHSEIRRPELTYLRRSPDERSDDVQRTAAAYVLLFRRQGHPGNGKWTAQQLEAEEVDTAPTASSACGASKLDWKGPAASPGLSSGRG